MDPKKYEAMKVRGAFGIAITTTRIDPRYSLQYSPDVDATKSAHIVLFILTPNASGLPVFCGRWDDAATAVDIDLEGPRAGRLAFKWGLPGHVGHHTTQVSTSPRKYTIDIHIPGIHVFQGEISLGTKIGARVEDTFHVMDAASALVSKPTLLRRVARWLHSLFIGAFS